jgi:D-sedoheptulose 7-phosphate isomerase
MQTLTTFIEARMLERNRVSRAFFPREASRLAVACREMAERFLRGGRLLAFGRRQSATDAQHVSVEFVHPVIVGKRALPALDLSCAYREWLPAIVRSDDIVMGFAPPEGDADVADALRIAGIQGCQTFALPGAGADFTIDPPSDDPFIHQEIIEVLYHTLWETVHVFFEHRERGYDLGETEFLYPFLGREKQETGGLIGQVEASIAAKAEEDERLREEVVRSQGEAMVGAAVAIRDRIRQGGTLMMFGNGGSATDANDWALDCAVPLKRHVPMPAVSLSMEPATLSALANDIGADSMFARQLIAQARPGDVAVAISTSGGSANIIGALQEARTRGLLTVALLGYDGGEVVRRELVDHPLVVPCDYIPRIQEIQASIYHTLVDLLATLEAGS